MARSRIRPSGKAASLAVLFTLLISGVVYAQNSTTASSPEDIKNQQDNLRWREDNCKHYRNELKDILRDVKNVDTKGANALLDKCDSQLNICRGLLGKPDFWDCSANIDEVARDLDDYFQDNLRPLRQCANINDSLKNRRRELKDIDRNIKDIKKGGGDTSAIDTWRSNTESFITKCEQLAVSCNVDTAEDASDCERDLNEQFDEWYSNLSRKADVARQLKDLQRVVKDKEKQLKDLTREFNRVSKRAPADVLQKLQGIVAKYTQTLESFRACVNNPSLEDARDCWDINSELDTLVGDPDEGFWTVLQQVQEKESLAQCQKDRAREHKQNLRQVKDLRREETRLVKQLGAKQVSNVTQCINVYENALKEAEALIPTDRCHEYWNVFNELEPIGDDEYAQTPPGACWNLMDRLRQVGDSVRLVKEFGKQVEQNRKECQRIEKEAKRRGGDPSAVLSLCGKFEDARKSLESAQISGDFDTFFDIWNEIHGPDGLWNQWGEALRNFWERGQIFGLCKEFSQGAPPIEEALRHLENLKAEGEIDQDTFEFCSGAMSTGLKLVTTVQKACKAGDEATLQKAGEQLGQLHQRAELRCGEYFEEEPREFHYEDFEDRFEEIGREQLEDIGKRISDDLRTEVFEKIVVQLQEELIKKIFEALEERFKASIAVMLENLAATNPGVSQSVVQEKLAALDCASQMKNIADRPGGEKLRDIIGRVEVATPVGQSAKDLQSFCQSFVTRASDVKGKDLAELVSELSGQVDKILVAASKEAVEQGITCFADVPLDQWYHKEVCGAAQFGIIEGSKVGGEPARDVNRVETLKIVSRVFHLDVPEPRSGEQWFAPYIRVAEEHGLTLAKKARKNPGQPATRAEVVQAILQGAGISQELQRETPYVDVPKSHPLSGFIAKATDIKLVSGTVKDGKRVFFPDRPVLRAEAARIGRNAFFLFGKFQPEADIAGEDEDEFEVEGEFEDEDEFEFE